MHKEIGVRKKDISFLVHFTLYSQSSRL